MKKLIEGLLDFRKNVLPERRELFAKLALGQSPDALFVTCSDSRVAPNWFASTNPGDLFVVRNIGNLVPPYKEASDNSVSAAIDFALGNLTVSDIVVCGHSSCGAMHALHRGLDSLTSTSLRRWLSPTASSLKHSEPRLAGDSSLPPEDQLSQASVLQQLENLTTYPLVRERMKSAGLRLHGWWFNIAEGGVYIYREESRRFALIDDELAQSLINKSP
jgi:carbonic anhydrase